MPVGAATPDKLLQIYKEVELPPDEGNASKDDAPGALVSRIREAFRLKQGDRIVLKAPVTEWRQRGDDARGDAL